MKLRIKGPSLRLRLTQGEMRRLEAEGVVEEHVPFAAGARLVYRLRRDGATPAIQADYRGSTLEIVVPEAAARSWCTTDLVTLSREQPTPQGTLRIVLEKDYACLAPRTDEDESDNFPHPAQADGKTC
jgi:hypothetical protein